MMRIVNILLIVGAVAWLILGDEGSPPRDTLTPFQILKIAATFIIVLLLVAYLMFDILRRTTRKVEMLKVDSIFEQVNLAHFASYGGWQGYRSSINERPLFASYFFQPGQSGNNGLISITLEADIGRALQIVTTRLVPDNFNIEPPYQRLAVTDTLFEELTILVTDLESGTAVARHPSVQSVIEQLFAGHDEQHSMNLEIVADAVHYERRYALDDMNDKLILPDITPESLQKWINLLETLIETLSTVSRPSSPPEIDTYLRFERRHPGATPRGVVTLFFTWIAIFVWLFFLLIRILVAFFPTCC